VLAIDSEHHRVELEEEMVSQPLMARNGGGALEHGRAVAGSAMQQTAAAADDLLGFLARTAAEIADELAYGCVELDEETLPQPLIVEFGGGGAEHEASSDDLSAGVAP
jgi:hypothetical protein